MADISTKLAEALLRLQNHHNFEARKLPKGYKNSPYVCLAVYPFSTSRAWKTYFMMYCLDIPV